MNYANRRIELVLEYWKLYQVTSLEKEILDSYGNLLYRESQKEKVNKKFDQFFIAMHGNIRRKREEIFFFIFPKETHN